MMTSRRERLEELQVARALGSLSPAEARELDVLERESGRQGSTPDETFELVAAAGVLAQLGEAPEPLPPALQQRLFAQADAWADEPRRRGAPASAPGALPRLRSPQRSLPGEFGSTTGAGAQVIVVPAERPRGAPRSRWVAGLAVAAAFAVAIGATYGRSHRSAASSGERAVEGSWAALVRDAGDVVVMEGAATPGSPAMRGTIAWSPSRQRGVLRIAALPPIAGAQRRYELWIVDEARPQGELVPAGLVDGAPTTQDVAFAPALPVTRAQRWVLTLEPARGSLRPTGPEVFAAGDMPAAGVLPAGEAPAAP